MRATDRCCLMIQHKLSRWRARIAKPVWRMGGRRGQRPLNTQLPGSTVSNNKTFLAHASTERGGLIMKEKGEMVRAR